jgi:hypothetical protein
MVGIYERIKMLIYFNIFIFYLEKIIYIHVYIFLARS